MVDMEMAKYIMSILRTNLMVVFSWGYHSPVAIDNGLEFGVEGYKHKGKVRVLYIEGLDLFQVVTLKKDGGVKEQVEEVYLDELVKVIDNMVEMVPDYKERVEEQYGTNA